MLSYLHLPPHLQKCFAYCSVFPQNHEFEIEELVHLWMAEGFIHTRDREKSAEEIGNEYFHDLHARFFFVEDMSSSHKTLYKMHPLFHGLACLVSTDICFQLTHDKLQGYPLFGNACHLSLHHDNVQPLELKASHKNERLRTFMVICKHGVSGGRVDQELFHNLKVVRVLDISNIGLREVPESIEHLIYLRYLNLSGNQVKSLPRSICKLLALQTLKLLNCPGILVLPSNMRNLSNLRHLIFDRLSCMPPEFGKLTNLRTLSSFVVGGRKGHGIEELEKMDFLRGSLSIKNIQNVSNEKNAIEAKLDMKPHLNKLELLWNELYDGQDIMEQQARVLMNLQPHKNLEEVTVKNYSGIKCPDWLSDAQRKFTRIHLQNLGYCKTLPPFGQLPHLKYLCIGEMQRVDRIDDGFYGGGTGVKFPVLESLEVYQMAELIEWTEDSNGSSVCMPRLTTSRIADCPKLNSLPSRLWSIADLKISRCSRL